VIKIERQGHSSHFSDIDKIGGARGKVRPENGLNAQTYVGRLVTEVQRIMPVTRLNIVLHRLS